MANKFCNPLGPRRVRDDSIERCKLLMSLDWDVTMTLGPPTSSTGGMPL
jgi:hypothetical protein